MPRTWPHDPGARFNVAPTDEAAVVVQRDDRRAIVRYRWGLVPAWSDDPKIASKTFNARAETLATSPAVPRRVPPAALPRPCRRVLRVAPRGHGARRRCGSTTRPDRPLALAGLWTGRQDAETGEWRRTFTIVTTRPNEFMASIHDRMPVVVPPDAWATWLDPAPRDPGELRALLEPREDLVLAAYAGLAAGQQRPQRRAGADPAARRTARGHGARRATRSLPARLS